MVKFVKAPDIYFENTVIHTGKIDQNHTMVYWWFSAGLSKVLVFKTRTFDKPPYGFYEKWWGFLSTFSSVTYRRYHLKGLCWNLSSVIFKIWLLKILSVNPYPKNVLSYRLGDQHYANRPDNWVIETKVRPLFCFNKLSISLFQMCQIMPDLDYHDIDWY